jgi:hypothetical protein
MSTDFFLNWQFGMTLVVGLALAAWLLLRVQRQRHQRGEEGHVSTPTADRAAGDRAIGDRVPGQRVD